MSRIAKNYTNKNIISSFSGLPIVLNANKHTSAKKIKAELQKIPSWNLFRPVRNKYKTRNYRVFFPNFQYSIDLADFGNLSRFNNGYRYCLVCIDVFTRFVSIEITKKKDGKTIAEAFESILRRTSQAPCIVISDKGTEFISKEFKKVMEKYGIIELIHVHSMKKAAHAERFIATMRVRLARMQYQMKTKNFTKLLPIIVKNYNSQANSTTKFAPREINSKNQDIVWRNIFTNVIKQKKKPLKFAVGDHVAISRERLLFEKSSSFQKYTSEEFVIRKAVQAIPTNYYFLKDLNNEDIVGTFYDSELTKLNYNSNGKR